MLSLPIDATAGALTEQIDRAHDIARRVPAQLDVQRLLSRSATPTPS